MSGRLSEDSLLPVLQEVRSCTLCAEHLPEGPRPVFQSFTSAITCLAGDTDGIVEMRICDFAKVAFL